MKRRVLFLQLPALDNDANGARENLPLAGIYLSRALRRSDEKRAHEPLFLSEAEQDGDNASVRDAICEAQPDVVAVTLYLWNIERSLRILGEVKRRLPHLRIVAGGPEAAFSHPFLFRSSVPDAVVVGEGETVFPGILAGFRTGAHPSLTSVAWRQNGRFEWGRHPAPAVRLRHVLPPPGSAECLDGSGMGYLETTRGCPMSCAFCRYHHLRQDVDVLNAAEVVSRVRGLIRHGAHEIRFIDPTFNANPHFRQIIRRLADLNRAGDLAFFAELKADIVSAEDADLLAAAHFQEIEVGLQSMDASVLKAIGRPTRMEPLERGVRLLASRGIHVTLDVMYGLPRQTAEDVYRSVRWGMGIPGVHVQCMQTLLLPGTDLRTRASRLGLRATSRPPYGITASDQLQPDDITRIEQVLQKTPELPADCPTPTFVGRVLPELFADRTVMPLPARDLEVRPGASRRVLVFEGDSLFEHRAQAVAAIRRALRREPDSLWQFVFSIRREEPLDLLDAVIAELRRHPLHLLDRYAAASSTRRLASRRVYVQLLRGRRYDPAWKEDVEQLLRRAFY